MATQDINNLKWAKHKGDTGEPMTWIDFRRYNSCQLHPCCLILTAQTKKHLYSCISPTFPPPYVRSKLPMMELATISGTMSGLAALAPSTAMATCARGKPSSRIRIWREAGEEANNKIIYNDIKYPYPSSILCHRTESHVMDKKKPPTNLRHKLINLKWVCYIICDRYKVTFSVFIKFWLIRDLKKLNAFAVE